MRKRENTGTYCRNGNLYHETKPKGHDHINLKHCELKSNQVPRKNEKGFTLLEMIIFLSIVALIFIISLPSIESKQEEVHNKQRNEIYNQQECICTEMR